MYGKLLLIALVCVSVAQVHGDRTETAIKNALKKVNRVNEQTKSRYNRAVGEYYESSFTMDLQFGQSFPNARKVLTASRESLRKVAAAVEEKAMQNNSPESVFRCIRRNEDSANDRIEILNRNFNSDMQKLYEGKGSSMKIAGKVYDYVESLLEDKYNATVRIIKAAQDPESVVAPVKDFTDYAKAMVDSIQNVERDIASILADFQSDAVNFFKKYSKEVSIITFTATEAIEKCYRSGRDLEESQEF